ncbi:MAG: hypothetical protein LBL83_11420 [Clostridiales bacterium]|jgi:hypothetical protein|nr:hypothetical protein [Clostridiales bacterium]
MMYRTCPYCGANNDPGERCECLGKMPERDRWPERDERAAGSGERRAMLGAAENGDAENTGRGRLQSA